MKAVIRSGGRQYRVSTGDVIEVNRLHLDEGADVELTPVLLMDGKTVKATPNDLSGASVKGKVVGHLRGRKIRVFTYKAKSGWKRTKGHRQELTTVEITGIS